MKVILLEDVDRLGKRGAVLNVANGYGRNFLIPRKLAVPATDANMKFAEVQNKKVQVQEAKEEKSASVLKAELEKVSITIPMKSGESDVLFGSVTSANIAEALEKEGYTIDKRRIELEEPIKRLGDYHVSVKLHRNIAADVKVSVVKE
jgi:large subunit ribosomal protein L9